MTAVLFTSSSSPSPSSLNSLPSAFSHKNDNNNNNNDSIYKQSKNYNDASYNNNHKDHKNSINNNNDRKKIKDGSIKLDIIVDHYNQQDELLSMLTTTMLNHDQYKKQQQLINCNRKKMVTFRERVSFDRAPSYYSEVTPINPWESTFNSKQHLFQQLISFFFILFITVGIPLTLFFTTRNHIEAIYSLLICAILPLLYMVYVLIRHHKLDIFSFLLVLTYIISGVVSLATGDTTITLLRDSAVTAVVALLFYATMLPIENKWLKIRPLTFIFSTEMLIDAKATYHWINPKGIRQEMSVVDWVWSMRKIRIYHYCLTCGWATFLMADYIVRVIMVIATDISVHNIYLSGSIIVIIELIIMSVLGVIVAVMTRKVTREWVQDNDYTEKYGWKMEQLRSFQYQHHEEDHEDDEEIEEVQDR